ncbi:MAG TPA: helix-turn-helix transcriptional regulator [Ktedonobacteraceae bacterium]|nr:helix-turn-helix transcriptional regulator [Ktedonobacteraceae bacterium]
MSVITSLSERRCRNCGTKLSRYNPDPLCWSCQDEKRSTIPDTQAPSSLPTLSSSARSAFTLRSILHTVRRTKPLRLSDVGQALKNYRSIHQLTQRDLASLLEFDQSYISKLENGQGLRDSATLRHIAQRLSISGSSLGILSEELQYAQSPEIIDTASSVIRLSQTVRESGRAEAAVNELWPLILRLETQQVQDNGNPRLLLTLASAQATLGIILGDLLPEENLWISVHFFKKAVAIADEHGDALFKSEVYRGCGNELRKHKHYTEAVSYLEQAFFLAPDAMSKGMAAALLARTYGEMGDQENFLDAIGSVLYAQEKVDSFTPTFNPVTIYEVRVRGLLNVGQMNAQLSLLEQDTTHFFAVPIAPQWHVISQLTRAEAMFHIGRVDEGLANLKTALIGAELCRLPHQVQRAIRAVQTVEAYSPARAMGDEAKLLLGKLAQPMHQFSLPQ